mmetsp:Transcript_30222/g.85369  ORF Transcript_30222/g.85369 Transcript_30222/m.85369 type:complete len:226 (-) Transcript_30222:480-1157(-)
MDVGAHHPTRSCAIETPCGSDCLCVCSPGTQASASGLHPCAVCGTFHLHSRRECAQPAGSQSSNGQRSTKPARPRALGNDPLRLGIMFSWELWPAFPQGSQQLQQSKPARSCAAEAIRYPWLLSTGKQRGTWTPCDWGLPCKLDTQPRAHTHAQTHTLTTHTAMLLLEPNRLGNHRSSHSLSQKRKGSRVQEVPLAQCAMQCLTGWGKAEAWHDSKIPKLAANFF